MLRSRRRFVSLVALGVTLLVAGRAAAEPSPAGWRPGQAQPISLGEVRGIAYYTVEPDGAFRVVATLTAGEDARPLRSVVTLRPGQATSLSVPGPDGVAPAEVIFERRGDRLVVAVPRQREAALR